MSRWIRDEAGRIILRLDRKTEADVERIEANQAKGFNAMVRAGRLDPAKDFQYSDFTGISLAGADLHGFNFTGARLEGTELHKAKVDETTILKHARLDGVDRKALRAILLPPKPTAPPPDFDEEKVRDMILAGQPVPPDWVPWVTELSFFNEQAIIDTSLLAGLANLQSLEIITTPITGVAPLASLVNLTILRIFNEPNITDVTPLAGLVNLQSLDLSGTGITDAAPLANLVNLKELCLSGASITDATPFASLVNMQELDLSHTLIVDVSHLVRLVNLQFLDLTNTPIIDAMSFVNLVNLKNLSLTGTNITNLQPLERLINLEALDLIITKITDVTPLAALSNLKRLYIAGTHITDVSPLAALPHLALIDVQSQELAEALLPQLGAGWRVANPEDGGRYDLRRDVPGVEVDD